MGHAGSDIEVGYKSLSEIERIESDDPLLHSARIMLEKKCLTSSEILSLYEQIREQISCVFNSAVLRPSLIKSEDVMSAIVANKNKRNNVPFIPNFKSRKNIFGKEFERLKIPQHMGCLLYTSDAADE